MIGTAAALFVKLTEIVELQIVNNGIDNTNGAFSAMFSSILCGKSTVWLHM